MRNLGAVVQQEVPPAAVDHHFRDVSRPGGEATPKHPVVLKGAEGHAQLEVGQLFVYDGILSNRLEGGSPSSTLNNKLKCFVFWDQFNQEGVQYREVAEGNSSGIVGL